MTHLLDVSRQTPASGSRVALLTPSASNPIVTQIGSTLTTFGDVVFDSSTGLFHLFVMVDGASSGIYEITGSSLESLSMGTATRVLSPGTQTWEDMTVGVPTAWKEGTTWYLLYAGTGSGHSGRQIGLATRTGASGSFTRASTSPVLAANGTNWESGDIESGAGRLIKISSTYYLFFSIEGGASGPVRQSGVATSTDLMTWTKDASNPIFGGWRFCNSIWTEGGSYYSLCPHYVAAPANAVQIELWQSSSPQFYPADRTLVGVVLVPDSSISWSAAAYDTPALVTDDITRASWACTGDTKKVVYAGEDASGNWLEGVATLNGV